MNYRTLQFKAYVAESALATTVSRVFRTISITGSWLFDRAGSGIPAWNKSRENRAERKTAVAKRVLSSLNGGMPKDVLARACETLCLLAGLPEGMWSISGPTELAKRWKLKRHWDFPSQSAQTLFRVAWDLWNYAEPLEAPRVTLNQLLELDTRSLLVIAGFFDAWSKRPQPEIAPPDEHGEIGGGR